jgi:SAM-dependent methyltransferase
MTGVARGPQAGGDIYARRRLKHIAARWDARADSWDRQLADPACHLNEDDAYHRFLLALRRSIARRRPFCRAHGVIDLGCGTGLVLAEVVNEFAWGIGVDISPQMIRLARAKGVANTTFLVGDAFRLPELCPQAGAVVSRGVLLSHYGPAQGREILRAACAVLAPDGFLLCDFLNAAARTRSRHAPETKAWFTVGEMQALARGAGFARVTCSGSAARRVLHLLARR